MALGMPQELRGLSSSPATLRGMIETGPNATVVAEVVMSSPRKHPPRLLPLSQRKLLQLQNQPSTLAGCSTSRKSKQRTGLVVKTKSPRVLRDAVNHRLTRRTSTQIVLLRSMIHLSLVRHSVMTDTIARGISHLVAVAELDRTSLQPNQHMTVVLVRDHTLQMYAPRPEILATGLPCQAVSAGTGLWTAPMRGAPTTALGTSSSRGPPHGRITIIGCMSRSQATVG